MEVGIQLYKCSWKWRKICGFKGLCESKPEILKDFCNFVCWTPKGIYIEHILCDTYFFDQLKPFLDNFFVQKVLPILLTWTIEVTLPYSNCRRDKTYCLCGGPEEGRMNAWDNPVCSIEWFHYKCVSITRKPKGKWFCSNNCKMKILSLSIVKVDFHYHWGTTLGDKLDSAAHTVRILSINA